MRTCKYCGETMPLANFHQQTWQCKQCRQSHDKIRRQCKRNHAFSELLRRAMPSTARKHNDNESKNDS